MNNLLALTILSTLTLSQAFAGGGESQRETRKRNEDNMNCDLRSRVSNYKPRPSQARLPKKSSPLTTIACGDIISQSITVANDLNCPDVTGFALRILGSNITINGNGHKISAPSASAGIYVEGESNIVANFDVQNISSGYGLLAYNANGVKILSNNFSKNSIGIMLYTDRDVTANVLIQGNRAQSNSFAGIRTFSDKPGKIVNPTIRNNDLRFSGEFAIYVKAETYNIDGDDNNNLSGSSNGYYLKSGDFKVNDLDLSRQLINKRHFFVDSARTISFKDVDVSTFAPLNFSQERQGIDLYKVGSFKMDNVVAKNHYVGLKLETEGGVSTSGQLINCQFANQTFSGVYVISYDDTAYGTIRFTNAKFNLLSGVGKVLVNVNTIANIIFDTVKDCRDGRRDDDRNDRDDDHDDGHRNDHRDNDRH